MASSPIRCKCCGGRPPPSCFHSLYEFDQATSLYKQLRTSPLKDVRGKAASLMLGESPGIDLSKMNPNQSLSLYRWGKLGSERKA